MAHFAKLEDNVVTQVIVVNNDELLDENNQESEQEGIDFLHQTYNDSSVVWKQTSYNHNMRKNYAAIGYTYSTTRDAFISPKPYSSWTLNEETCRWDSPVSQPDDGEWYSWNEDSQSWVLFAV